MFCRVKQLFKLYYEEQSHFTNKKKGGSASCSATAAKRGKDASKSSYKLDSVPNVTFDDIAGHLEVKKDLQFIIDFLKNPQKYRQLGARMPKGIIFYGPPGTGKTLHAKAIAGSCGVPFLSVSGSDFVEKYVGVGAKRVRELFSEARELAPCIIFIDEIDAVGSKRNDNSSSEKDNTINALLTELDGFKTSSDKDIIVIGATNRVDMLDSALTRAGRFDRHVCIPLPEYEDRIEMIKVHSKNKPLSSEIDIYEIAKSTIGFSGADIENLLNESAIIAASRQSSCIVKSDVEEAFFKIALKGNKRSIKNSDPEKLRVIAWHEAGHALASKLLTKQSVPKVTITPSTSGYGGVTFIVPDNMGLRTKRDIINDVKISYGGRAAEFMLASDEELITTGASQDIKNATSKILQMIGEFGMSQKFGMLHVDSSMGGSSGQLMDEARIISDSLYKETVSLLKDNMHSLEQIANALLEKETIYESEIDNIIERNRKKIA